MGKSVGQDGKRLRIRKRKNTEKEKEEKN